MIYGGQFDVGHGGAPLIVLFTSAPAVIVFTIILFASMYKFKSNNETNLPQVKNYYISILLNILINTVSSYALLSI
jgi:hypothetical protein